MNTIHMSHIARLKWRHWLLITLLAIVTVVRSSHSLGLAYTTKVYPVIGGLLSPLSGSVPFALGDIFIALSIAWVLLYPVYELALRKRLAKRFIILRPRNGQYKKKLAVVARAGEYLLWVYAWFYMAWGLNYSQPDAYVRIGMRPVEASKAKLKWLREKGNEDEYEEKVKCEESILQGYYRIGGRGINAPFNHHPHVKTMVFTPLSSMAGVTGSMGPFFCEFTLNGDVRPHEYPATYAHELAHFLGVANEGEANFYSYLACTASADEAVRFSGYYSIFFHVINNVFDILGEKEGDKYLRHISPRVILLAKGDRGYWLNKRSKLLNAAQDLMLDIYLRGNNVSGGRKSYSGVIGLIMAWEEKKSAQRPR